MPKITDHPGVSIFQLADGRYVARWIDPFQKKQKQESLEDLPNKKARVQWAKEKAAQLKQTKLSIKHGRAIGDRKSLTDARDEFLNRSKITEVTREVQTAPMNVIVGFLATRGVQSTQDLKPVHVTELGRHIGTLGHKHSTHDRYIAIASTFLRWLIRERLVVDVRPDDLQLERIGVQPEIRALRPAEVQQALDACIKHDLDGLDDLRQRDRRRMGPLVLLAFLTGMRRDELRFLQWREIDLEEEVIRLPRERTKGGERRGKAREIDLSICPTAVELLKAMHENRTDDVHVFGEGGFGRSAVSEGTRRLAKKHGAPADFTIKHCRATCGTVLANAQGLFGDASVFMAAKRLGHNIAVAEKFYWRTLKVPAHVRTIELALGIEEQAKKIVALAKGETIEVEQGTSVQVAS